MREVQEVRNAIVAYEHLPSWSTHSQKYLWAAHGALMVGLLDRVGVMSVIWCRLCLR